MDTNHVAALEGRQPNLMAKMRALPPESQVRACAITLGEIEAGHQTTTTTNQARRDAVRAFVSAEFAPNALPITHSTGWYYAQIVGRVCKATNKRASTRLDTHLVNQGVDVNDVWIVASAWEHGFTLLTTDKMECIRNVVSEVTWENWC